MNRLEKIQSALMHDIYHQDKTSKPYLDMGKFGSLERLDIYTNNLRLGLCESLKNVFPVIEQLVGEDFFEQVSLQYLKTHRLHEGNRNQFGHRFSHFLKALPVLQDMPYIAEVADIEWAYFQASIADNATALSFEQLQQAIANPEQYPDYTIKLHPSTRWIYQIYNSVEIWQQHLQGSIHLTDKTDQQETIEEIELKESNQYWLIWRDQNHELLLKPVPKSLICLLEQSQIGQPFADVMALPEVQSEPEALQLSFADTVNYGAFAL